mmetsp:Transcript_13678/g.31790  ORF Transcript_13678/g.31790 Transcript_13678/m.31790 type:complete len:87 (-) Transcript_13678:760-1020(-)
MLLSDNVMARQQQGSGWLCSMYPVNPELTCLWSNNESETMQQVGKTLFSPAVLGSLVSQGILYDTKNETTITATFVNYFSQLHVSD